MIDGFFMTGQKKSEGVFMSTQVSPSIVDQGTVALAVSSVLPTITVCSVSYTHLTLPTKLEV